MNTTLETIPQQWDDERDVAFFRITAALFAPDFCYGAGVLLASYDPDDVVTEPAPATAPYDVPSVLVTPTPTAITQ